MMTALASKWVRVKSQTVRNSSIWGKFSPKAEVSVKQENIIMIKPKKLCTFYIKELET